MNKKYLKIQNIQPYHLEARTSLKILKHLMQVSFLMFGVLNAKNLAFSTPDANALMDYMCFYRSPLFPFFFFKTKLPFWQQSISSLIFSTCSNLVPIANSLTEIDCKLKITQTKLTTTKSTVTPKCKDKNGHLFFFKHIGILLQFSK